MPSKTVYLYLSNISFTRRLISVLLILDKIIFTNDSDNFINYICLDAEKKKVCKSTSNQLSSDTDNQDDSQDSSESIKPNAIYEIVQAVRKETQLSHDMSKVAVETVLMSLRVRIIYIT